MMADTSTQPELEFEIPEATEANLSKSGTLEAIDKSFERSRDEDWYFENGDVVLLVQDRLFKVHKFLFARDSGFFETLFTLPQSKDSNEGRLEGQSDENPIICAADSVEDFRALCWGLYSRPPDALAQQNWDTADIPKIARVLAMSQKYDFGIFRDWALDVLDALSSAPLRTETFFGKLRSWGEIGRVLDLASQCGKTTLAQRMEEDWLRRIRSKDHSPLLFKYALDVAEDSSALRLFHGKVYYTYLQAAGIFDLQARDGFGANGIIDTPSNIDESLSDLSPQRMERIYRGFWSLSQLRVQLSQPPKLDDDLPCSGDHAYKCIPGWHAWWKDVLDKAAREGRQLNDPGKLIQEVQTKLASPIRYGSVTIPCNARITEQVRLMAESFDGSLADRFLGPE